MRKLATPWLAQRATADLSFAASAKEDPLQADVSHDFHHSAVNTTEGNVFRTRTDFDQ